MIFSLNKNASNDFICLPAGVYFVYLYFEEGFNNVSFIFSKPDDQAESIGIDIGEGSLLYKLSKFYRNTLQYQLNNGTRATGRDKYHFRNLKIGLYVDNLLIFFLPTSLICLTNFHEPVRL